MQSSTLTSAVGGAALVSLLLLSPGCGSGSKEQPGTPPAPAPGSAPVPIPAPVPEPAPPPAPITPVLTIDGFATPESVLHDPIADVYLVSNINGGPAEVDDNGFISRVSPDGTVLAPRWIDGARPEVELHAPKGSAISGGVLWVADITVVRKFDATSGKPVGQVAVTGATFLNDVAADGAGGVWVTDSGVDGQFASTGTDAIHRIGADGTVTQLIASRDLGSPNGVVTGPAGSVWVVSFGSGQLYQIDAAGKQSPPETLPKGQLDGIVALDSGELLVSSWEGQAVYRGKPGAWTASIPGIATPADIGWDAKRQLVLVPDFLENQVLGYRLP